MKDTDHLKEVFGKLDQIHEPIDLEETILTAIEKERTLKAQIAKYRSYGKKSLIVSGILVAILGILFSRPSTRQSMEHTILAYTSIGLVLVVILVQLEAGGSKIFNQLKNNRS
ncbi:hypothetical protein [Maribacter aurantiacus]|uniref:Uncharacterized protein n=1 Tax=Maribacter aurantiacus TaxID=1882343 RepID=A0A5R8M6T6_9FLAO|nr:hypothetical protein [Maribacter aurantiacus]TLF45281.1 hypothetical protein FEK29_07810 [Maribacter aurantiacus]